MMIKSDGGLFGPFARVDVSADTLVCFAAEPPAIEQEGEDPPPAPTGDLVLPIDVIGAYEILDTDPPGPAQLYDWIGTEWVLKPATPESLASARAAKWEDIKAERDRRTQEGGYQAGGKWYHSDTFSRTQQLGLVMLGNNLPAGVQWKTMDGSFVAMTPALAQQIFAAAAANDIAVFAAAEAHRANLAASDDPVAYDYASGWPAAFGEQ